MVRSTRAQMRNRIGESPATTSGFRIVRFAPSEMTNLGWTANRSWPRNRRNIAVWSRHWALQARGRLPCACAREGPSWRV